MKADVLAHLVGTGSAGGGLTISSPDWGGGRIGTVKEGPRSPPDRGSVRIPRVDEHGPRLERNARPHEGGGAEPHPLSPGGTGVVLWGAGPTGQGPSPGSSPTPGPWSGPSVDVDLPGRSARSSRAPWGNPPWPWSRLSLLPPGGDGVGVEARTAIRAHPWRDPVGRREDTTSGWWPEGFHPPWIPGADRGSDPGEGRGHRADAGAFDYRRDAGGGGACQGAPSIHALLEVYGKAGVPSTPTILPGRRIPRSPGSSSGWTGSPDLDIEGGLQRPLGSVYLGGAGGPAPIPSPW